MQAKKFRIIAHRGASADAPENTMAAIKLAWQQNTDALEIDVHKTIDNQLAVIHDADTLRTTGMEKIISEHTLAKLQSLDAGSWKSEKWKNEYIPSLEEVLKTVPKNKDIFIEIKGGRNCLPLLEKILSNFNLKSKQITLMDFNLQVVQKAKEMFPQFEVLWLYEFIPPSTQENHQTIFNEIISCASQAQMDGINIEENRFIDEALIKDTHNHGLLFYTWTINDTKRAQFLIDAQIDGITTDKPGWLKKNLHIK
jgi:glycerophosphoryl diester phosphodiesterase